MTMVKVLYGDDNGGTTMAISDVSGSNDGVSVVCSNVVVLSEKKVIPYVCFFEIRHHSREIVLAR